MSDRVEIRPSRITRATVIGMGVLVAMFIAMIIRSQTMDPAHLHCERTAGSCSFTTDAMITGVSTRTLPLANLHRSRLVRTTKGKMRWVVDDGNAQLELGQATGASRERDAYATYAPAFAGFLDGGAQQPTFDASWTATGNLTLGLAFSAILLVFAALMVVRGWKVDITVDRASSQVAIRRWPLMGKKSDVRGALRDCTARIDSRRPYWIGRFQRHLMIEEGHRVLLDTRAIGAPRKLVAVQALLEQRT